MTSKTKRTCTGGRHTALDIFRFAVFLNNKFSNSFFPFISKIWNNLPNATKSKNLFDFKAQMKTDIKPERHKHFSVGPKESNQLMTRFRTGRTNLNLDKFTIGQSDEPNCMCHAKN